MKPGMVAHTYGPCAKEAEEEGHEFQISLGLGKWGKKLYMVWFGFFGTGSCLVAFKKKKN